MVTPERTPVDITYGDSLASSPQGTWVFGRGSDYLPVLVHVQNGQQVQRETITDRSQQSFGWSAHPEADGGVAVAYRLNAPTGTYSSEEDSVLVRIRPDGTRVQQRFTSAQAGDHFYQGTLDAQGYYWFLKPNDRYTYGSPVSLLRVSPDGTLTTLKTDLPYLQYYGDGSSLLLASPDRQLLVFRIDNVPYRVDTAAGTVTADPTLAGDFRLSAVADNGTLYGFQSALVTQVTPDGQMSAVPALIDLPFYSYSDTVIGIDRTDSNILWVQGVNTDLMKVNLSASTRQAIRFGSSYGYSLKGLALNTDGGVSALVNDSYGEHPNLSVVK